MGHMRMLNSLMSEVETRVHTHKVWIAIFLISPSFLSRASAKSSLYSLSLFTHIVFSLQSNLHSNFNPTSPWKLLISKWPVNFWLLNLKKKKKDVLLPWNLSLVNSRAGCSWFIEILYFHDFHSKHCLPTLLLSFCPFLPTFPCGLPFSYLYPKWQHLSKRHDILSLVLFILLSWKHIPSNRLISHISTFIQILTLNSRFVYSTACYKFKFERIYML